MQALALASLIWLSATAPTPAAEPQAGPVRGVAQSAGAGGKKKKVIRLDAITVEGRIQKPQAFYILQRSQLDFDELSRAETFVPKVLQSVEKEPL